MYEHSENLRKLDQVLVTNREFDKVLAWKMAIQPKQFKKMRNLKPETMKKPPQPKLEEDEKKNQASGSK